MQGTTPGEELVTRGRRDMTCGLETCLLQLLNGLIDAVWVLATTAAQEDVTRSLHVLEILWLVNAPNRKLLLSIIISATKKSMKTMLFLLLFDRGVYKLSMPLNIHY